MRASFVTAELGEAADWEARVAFLREDCGEEDRQRNCVSLLLWRRQRSIKSSIFTCIL